MRALSSVMFVTLLAGVASAQPGDPYGDAAAPADLSAQVAQSLVARAQELLDARVYADARQLALEALAKDATGPTAAQARVIVAEANKALGLTERAPDPVPVAPPAPAATVTPAAAPAVPRERAPRSTKEIAARVHGGLFAGVLTGAFGTLISTDCNCGQDDEDRDGQLGAGLMFGIGGGVVGALIGPWAVDKIGWDEAQLRTVGSTSVWGGVMGMFIADAVHTEGTEPRHVFGGGAIGESVGALIGAGIASQRRFTLGDVALVDTFAGIGAVGGLTLGMLMQPAEGEAYSINATLGVAAGYLAGFVAGPLTSTTPRRMARVAGAAALGGAAPFALYALLYDESSHADERTVGFLSTAGLVVGAYVGFRLTRSLDAGRDTAVDAPQALVGRGANGQWALGAPTVAPLSQALAPQRGMAFSLVGGSF